MRKHLQTISDLQNYYGKQKSDMSRRERSSKRLRYC